MQIDMTPKRAKTVARRFSDLSSDGAFGQAKALETLAEGLGFNSWSALKAKIDETTSGTAAPAAPAPFARSLVTGRAANRLPPDTLAGNVCLWGADAQLRDSLARSAVLEAARAGAGALMVSDRIDAPFVEAVRSASDWEGSAVRVLDMSHGDLQGQATHDWNPFERGDVDQLVDILACESALGQGMMYAQETRSLLWAALPALLDLRATESGPVDGAWFAERLRVGHLDEIVHRGSDGIRPENVAKVRSWLETVPGYDFSGNPRVTGRGGAFHTFLEMNVGRVGHTLASRQSGLPFLDIAEVLERGDTVLVKAGGAGDENLPTAAFVADLLNAFSRIAAGGPRLAGTVPTACVFTRLGAATSPAMRGLLADSGRLGAGVVLDFGETPELEAANLLENEFGSLVRTEVVAAPGSGALVRDRHATPTSEIRRPAERALGHSWDDVLSQWLPAGHAVVAYDREVVDVIGR